MIILTLLYLFLDGLVRRFIRDDDGVHFDKPSPSYDQKDFVPIEVKAGSLVVIHGDLIHQRSVNFKVYLSYESCGGMASQPFCGFTCSFENQSHKSRHAYSLHVVDTDSCKWAPDNW